MNFNGETFIQAPRQKVWDGLNDPDVLRACIPGCDSLVTDGPDKFQATVRQKIGPVSASFNGFVTIEDANPPNSYRLVGQGSGGVAGFAKGGALVTLSDAANGTMLTYEAEAQLGGKIAQLGGRMMTGVANNLAAEFFTAFGENVSGIAATTKAVDEKKSKYKKISTPKVMPAQVGGPGWRLFALTGWAVAVLLGVLLILDRLIKLVP